MDNFGPVPEEYLLNCVSPFKSVLLETDDYSISSSDIVRPNPLNVDNISSLSN